MERGKEEAVFVGVTRNPLFIGGCCWDHERRRPFDGCTCT